MKPRTWRSLLKPAGSSGRRRDGLMALTSNRTKSSFLILTVRLRPRFHSLPYPRPHRWQRNKVLESPEVRDALCVVRAWQSSDYATFFRALREQRLMHRCLLSQYVGSMRHTAIKVGVNCCICWEWKCRACTVCVYVCMVITCSRIWIDRVRLPILLVVN